MSDTDLITVEDSSTGASAPMTELPTVTADVPSVPPVAEAAADAPPTVSTGSATGPLATMVLPELRALANSVGVKGTSGMRKNDLITAIQDSQSSGGGSPSSGADTPGNAPAETPDVTDRGRC